MLRCIPAGRLDARTRGGCGRRGLLCGVRGDTPRRLRDECGHVRKHRRFLYLPLARGPPMLPPATVPGAAGGVTPPDAAARDGREQRAPRDAATGRAEVMAIRRSGRTPPACCTELPGAGGGIVACGALPGAAAPGPAWTADQLAAAGIAGEPRPVREGTGLGLASAVLTPALLDAALAGLRAAVAEDHAAAGGADRAGAGADARHGCGNAADAGAAAPGSRPGI